MKIKRTSYFLSAGDRERLRSFDRLRDRRGERDRDRRRGERERDRVRLKLTFRIVFYVRG